MNEVDKLYKNAGVEQTHYDACTLEDKYWKDGSMQNLYGTFDCYLSFECPHYGEGCYSTCEYAYDKDEYPPFTAEKQLELIKWLSDTDYYIHNIYKTIDTKEYCIENDFYDIQTNKFEEALARLINKLWQDLTEEERKQIKNILESEVRE